MKNQQLPTHDPRVWPQAGDVITWQFGVSPNIHTIYIMVIDYQPKERHVKFVTQYHDKQVHDSMYLMDWRDKWEGFPITSLINGDQPDIIWTPV